MIAGKRLLIATMVLAVGGWAVWMAVSLRPIGQALPDWSSTDQPAAENLNSPEDPAMAFKSSPPQDASGVGEKAIPETCAELFRLVEESNKSIDISPDRELTDERCGVMLRIHTGARMQALPGLASDYRIPDLTDNHPAKRLANEADEPAWSRPMENRIVSEIQGRVGVPVPSLAVVCRSTICGLVFISSEVTYYDGNYNRFGRQLADSFGFSSYTGGTSSPSGGIGYTYVYIGDF